MSMQKTPLRLAGTVDMRNHPGRLRPSLTSVVECMITKAMNERSAKINRTHELARNEQGWYLYSVIRLIWVIFLSLLFAFNF
jgi:hypothetical protein